MTENFYTDLQTFTNFSDTFDKKHYQSVPKDWFVIVADVKDSTIAIESGKYKDVNLVGSACIGAVLNEGDYPFVFGGDGASFLVPPSKLEVIKSALLKIKNSARKRYDLELRVGVVPVCEILEAFDLKVAKYELAKGRYIAKFSGGGLSYADNLIKSESRYLINSSNPEEESSFDRVSCRWNPIKNIQGVILTLLVKTNDLEDYKYIQSSLDEILGNDQSVLNPVKPNKMTYLKLGEMYKNEKNYEAHTWSLSALKRKIEIFMAFLIFDKFRDFQPKFLQKYTQSMQQHSDYRKFDDVLRMVIDCSQAQVAKIIETLNSSPNLKYGYFCSDHALMTCLVFGLGEGGHIHFIDGANGGYTQAAKMLKKVI